MMAPSRLLMGSSSICLIAIGAVFNFAPAEFAEYLGFPHPAVLPLQLWAAALLAAGVINWMSKGNTIGGIYGRPLCVGNLLHFVVGAFALGRFAGGTGAAPWAWLACAIYAIFAVCFAWLLFAHPNTASQGK